MAGGDAFVDPGLIWICFAFLVVCSIAVFVVQMFSSSRLGQPAIRVAKRFGDFTSATASGVTAVLALGWALKFLDGRSFDLGVGASRLLAIVVISLFASLMIAAFAESDDASS